MNTAADDKILWTYQANTLGGQGMYDGAFGKDIRRVYNNAAARNGGVERSLNAISLFSALNLVAGAAVAVASLYTGPFERMLTAIFLIQVVVALVLFLLMVRWVRS